MIQVADAPAYLLDLDHYCVFGPGGHDPSLSKTSED